MSLKYTLLSLLCLLLIDSIISHEYEVVKKYGKETTYNKYIFIETSGFDTGDKIYISITNHNGYDNSRILYKFLEKIDDISNIDEIPALSYRDYSSRSQESTSYGYYDETFNYKIKKDDSNGNYLFLKFDFNPPVTVENTKNDATVIIIISVVVCVVVIAIFITVFCCCCRRCKNTQTYGTVAYPVTTVGYEVSTPPYGGQIAAVPVAQPVVQGDPQPVMNVQPYDGNYPQNQAYLYNQGEQLNQNIQIPQGSDNRISDKPY